MTEEAFASQVCEVRIADSSEAVAVVNHVVAGSAGIRGLRESISGACGYSARGLK
jgi:hypothetical protein